MEAFADSIIAFIGRNQAWTPWIMVVFAAAETTAFLSILIPSTAVMVALGALVARPGRCRSFRCSWGRQPGR